MAAWSGARDPVRVLPIRREPRPLAEQGTISPGDQDILDYAKTADDAWGIISRFYGLPS